VEQAIGTRARLDDLIQQHSSSKITTPYHDTRAPTPISTTTTGANNATTVHRIPQPLLDRGQGKYPSPVPATAPLPTPPNVTQAVTPIDQPQKHDTHQAYQPNGEPPQQSTAHHLTSTTEERSEQPASPLTPSSMHPPKGGQHRFTPNGVRFGSDPPVSPGNWPGLQRPTLKTGELVTGANKATHRRENKQRRRQLQRAQPETSYWSTYQGTLATPQPKQPLTRWRNCMCPSGLALHHPAAGELLHYATNGCPANTGCNWTRDEMEAAIKRGPHVSAREPAAMQQLAKGLRKKSPRNRPE
jgi:hypothetical protein